MENRSQECFIVLKKWMENRNAGKDFATYFSTYGYRKIAIYGAGDVGRLLYYELKDSDIRVLYYIDRNAEGLGKVEGIPVITAEEIKNAEAVDGIVVSPVGSYQEICELLTRLVPEIPTISLKDAVYEV